MITTADALKHQISKPVFLEYVKQMGLRKMAHGIYASDDAWPDIFRQIQMQYASVIFSHESSLYLHGISEREPDPIAITVKRGYHSSSMKEYGLKIYTISPANIGIGLTVKESPTGYPVRCYNIERTLCETERQGYSASYALWRDIPCDKETKVIYGGAAMIHTARQLKALVRNRSNSDSKKAQTLIRIYTMERFLERLSVSKYRDYFILKGGILVSSMVGVDRRSTMDIDTTIRNLNLSIEDARSIVEEISAIPLEDGIRFELQDVSEIMEDAEYSGVRLHLTAWLETMRTPIKIDISTGDVITPREIRYSYKLMFEDRSIELYTYNLDTILAEKMETILSRGTVNTRLRDFYDVYILSQQYADEIMAENVYSALMATSKKRGSEKVILDGERILSEIFNSQDMISLWENYQNRFEYAAEAGWHDVMDAVIGLYRNLAGATAQI